MPTALQTKLIMQLYMLQSKTAANFCNFSDPSFQIVDFFIIIINIFCPTLTKPTSNRISPAISTHNSKTMGKCEWKHIASKSCAKFLQDLWAQCSGSSISQSYSQPADRVVNCSTSSTERIPVDLLYLVIPEYVKLHR